MKDQHKVVNVTRWAARISAGVSIAILVMMSTELVNGSVARLSFSEGIGAVCFPVGVMIGLSVAFRKENIGALVALSSLVAFYLWHVSVSGGLPRGPWFLLFASPAVLFLLCGWLAPRHPPAPDTITVDVQSDSQNGVKALTPKT